MDEALFFLFSVVRPWTNSGFCYFSCVRPRANDCFCRFSPFVHGRTLFFLVYGCSPVDEQPFQLYLLNLFKCYCSTSMVTTNIGTFYCNANFIKIHMPRIIWTKGSSA